MVRIRSGLCRYAFRHLSQVTQKIRNLRIDSLERPCYGEPMQTLTTLFDPLLIFDKPSLIAVRESARHESPIPQILAQLALHGEACGVIVAHNRFDVYRIGDAAAEQGGTRDAALRQIFILRAETCQQMHGCLKRLVTRPLRFRFFFLLGMLEPFYDEEIRYTRAEWLLADSLRQMRRLAERGAHLLLTLAPPPTPARSGFLRLVQQSADLALDLEAPALTAPLQPELEL